LIYQVKIYPKYFFIYFIPILSVKKFIYSKFSFGDLENYCLQNELILYRASSYCFLIIIKVLPKTYGWSAL